MTANLVSAFRGSSFEGSGRLEVIITAGIGRLGLLLLIAQDVMAKRRGCTERCGRRETNQTSVAPYESHAAGYAPLERGQGREGVETYDPPEV
jgi:hypothetical protein